MLVFKGTSGGRVEEKKRIQKHLMIKERKIFAYCQQKTWNNEFIMKLWISEVLRKYSHFEIQKDTILLINDASMHKFENIQYKTKDCGTKISTIMGGLTWYLLPLNASISKPFKDELRIKIY